MNAITNTINGGQLLQEPYPEQVPVQVVFPSEDALVRSIKTILRNLLSFLRQ